MRRLALLLLLFAVVGVVAGMLRRPPPDPVLSEVERPAEAPETPAAPRLIGRGV